MNACAKDKSNVTFVDDHTFRHMVAVAEDLDVYIRLVAFVVDIDPVEVMASVVVDVDAYDVFDDGNLVVDAHADVVSHPVNLDKFLFHHLLVCPSLLHDHDCVDAVIMKKIY